MKASSQALEAHAPTANNVADNVAEPSCTDELAGNTGLSEAEGVLSQLQGGLDAQLSEEPLL